MKTFLRTQLPVAVAVVLLTVLASAVTAVPGLAQTPAASPLEMRHFWHVFIAYAIAWILIGGWLFTIVRRLRRLEDRLK